MAFDLGLTLAWAQKSIFGVYIIKQTHQKYFYIFILLFIRNLTSYRSLLAIAASVSAILATVLAIAAA